MSTGNLHDRSTGALALAGFFKNRAINGWPLFWLFALPMTAFMVIAMAGQDLSSADGVSHMIQYSVRWAVPFIYMVVAASAMPVLFPGEFTRWWLRNRRYIGLLFAVAMVWQGTFIFMLSSLHTDHYYDQVYLLRDELEGSSGYLFLAAMVVTSFHFGRRWFSSAQWKVLHRSGVYFLWAYPFSVYWWNLPYYGNPQPIDYIFYWTGFLAFASRIAAWGKKRQVQHQKTGGSPTPLLARLTGVLVIGCGLIASATGAMWREPIKDILLSPPVSASLELWLPFWPFELFLPLVAIGLGTWLLTRGSMQVR